jgi:hypothetical protein
VQTEIRGALEDELIDVERAAALLDMTEHSMSLRISATMRRVRDPRS